MIVGIDKIGLTTKDYQFDHKKSNWGYKLSGGIDQAKPVIYSKSGLIEANKVYLNTEYAQYSIEPHKGLQILFNPSKLHHGKGTHDLISTGDELDRVLTGVKNDLQGSGIELDFNSLNLYRVDLTKDAKMNYPVSAYDTAFRLLSMPRGKSKGYQCETWSFGNGQRQAQFYDKGLELKLDENDILRAEYKLLKRESVGKTLNADRIDKFVNLTPQELTLVYNEFMVRNLFQTKNNGQQSIIHFPTIHQNLVNDIRHWVNLFGNRNIGYYFGDKLPDIVSVMGFNSFMEAYSEGANLSMRTKVRKKKEILKMIKQIGINQQAEKLNPGQLLNEIELKIAS